MKNSPKYYDTRMYHPIEHHQLRVGDVFIYDLLYLKHRSKNFLHEVIKVNNKQYAIIVRGKIQWCRRWSNDKTRGVVPIWRWGDPMICQNCGDSFGDEIDYLCLECR